MTQAVICPNCGAKVRADRARCARCRAVFAAPPDPKVAAVLSRRLQKAAVLLVALCVLVVGVVWLRRDPPLAAVSPTSVAVDPLAARRPSVPAPALASASTAKTPAPVERPFLDPAASGGLAYAGGDYASALARYQAAVEKNPQDAESWSNLGQVLVRLNRAPEAIPALQQAIAIVPDRWAYQFNLARAFGQTSRWEDAVASYRRAQSLFPDDDVTAFNLALALEKKGDVLLAVKEYQNAIRLAPEDAAFRMALGGSLERQGNASEAAAAFKEYLRLSPSAPDADRVRAKIAQLSGSAAAPVPSVSREKGSPPSR